MAKPRQKKPKVAEKQLLKEAAVAAAGMLILTLLLSSLSFIQEFLKPIKQEFGDFDIYDLNYSSINKGNLKKDQRFVLVEYRDSHGEIGRQVNLLDSAGARVIAIDASFEKQEDPAAIDSLGHSLLNCKSVVVGSRILFNDQHSDISITKGVYSGILGENDFGYINLFGSSELSETDVSVKRYFTPSLRIGENRARAFACAVAMKFDSTITKKFLKRRNNLEIIDYTGGANRFVMISKEELDTFYQQGQLQNIIKDKIVIMGSFRSRPPLLLKDLHFTPMNEKLSGRSIPDNYGVVIQANIIAMILDGRSKKLGGKFISFILAFLISLPILYIYMKDASRHKHPGHWKYFLIAALAIIVITFVFLLIFKHLHFKIQLLPIILTMIFSIELVGIYKYFARLASKKWNYKTIFNT